MDRVEFERIVRDALDELPQEFRYALENVAVVVQEEPDPEVLDLDPDELAEGELLGLYVGTPLTERETGYTGLPDSVLIFRGPILRVCESLEEVVREIKKTVVHELGHHMGLDDHEMPY